MHAVLIFRIAAILFGLLLLVLAFLSLVKKRMTEGIALEWAVGAILLIVIGIVPCLNDWAVKLSTTHIIALLLFAIFVVAFMFRLSVKVSTISMKNQELAMQVSLLNQENERILFELEKLTGKNKVDI